MKALTLSLCVSLRRKIKSGVDQVSSSEDCVLPKPGTTALPPAAAFSLQEHEWSAWYCFWIRRRKSQKTALLFTMQSGCELPVTARSTTQVSSYCLNLNNVYNKIEFSHQNTLSFVVQTLVLFSLLYFFDSRSDFKKVWYNNFRNSKAEATGDKICSCSYSQKHLVLPQTHYDEMARNEQNISLYTTFTATHSWKKNGSNLKSLSREMLNGVVTWDDRTCPQPLQ